MNCGVLLHKYVGFGLLLCISRTWIRVLWLTTKPARKHNRDIKTNYQTQLSDASRSFNSDCYSAAGDVKSFLHSTVWLDFIQKHRLHVGEPSDVVLEAQNWRIPTLEPVGFHQPFALKQTRYRSENRVRARNVAEKENRFGLGMRNGFESLSIRWMIWAWRHVRNSYKCLREVES